ncbi:hypothetical protein ACFMQL_01205 [Nonomuraea fastidiosa]|jgi:hypothetical protein|uniref:hypothetical protein n=1 Tax=Nonomuraea fastidiosa TaxID=46173 RepID=UPI00367255EE
MKGKLIAAGGALATAAALCAMATPAQAIERCDLGISDRTHTLRIDPWGVYAGKRKAKACHRKRVHHDRFDRGSDDLGDEFDEDLGDDEAVEDEDLDQADERPHWSFWGHRGFDNGYGAARYGNWNGYNWPGPWYGV